METDVKDLEGQITSLKKELKQQKSQVEYYRTLAEETEKKSTSKIEELSKIIQETKASKDAFRRERDFLETITKSIGAGLAVMASDLRILWANEVLTNQFNNITGNTCFNVFKNLDCPCDNCPLSQVFEKHGDQIRYEEEVRSPNGKTFWIEVIVTPITMKNGRVEEVLALALPITKRKRAELERERLEAQLREAEKMKAIGTLAGGIAHDFNNLLMAIQGYTSLLLMDLREHPRYSEYLDGIEQLIRSGANLTKQLLAFSQHGKYQTKVSNLNNIVDHTVEIFHRTRKSIIVKKYFQDDLWNSEVDESQMEQVFMNLFINAWHSMPQGGTLSLRTKNVDLREKNPDDLHLAPGRYVRVSVSDTGTGMDPEIMKRIFEPFFTTKKMKRGSGLGLASAYGIIKNHGGCITVKSKLGVGSQFDVYIPATEKPLPKSEATPVQLEKGKETILVVDDEEPVLETTKKLLISLGYNVLTASSGKKALDIIRENVGKIALLILDMIMPEMGGEKVFELAMPLDPNLKVLLISGYSETDIARNILSNGCHGFLEKPFSITQLSQKIREILRS